jgi:glycosyltransferase involved in cell wall biosynthesis
MHGFAVSFPWAQITVVVFFVSLFHTKERCKVLAGAPMVWLLAFVVRPGGRHHTGFIGGFYAYEGLDLLLDALPALLQARPEVRLLLVGGGPQEAALRAQAQRLGVEDHVRFVGRVPHAEVQRYYDLVDVLCYPRHSMRLTELVTPLKPLEAMAQGRLLVASDVGGHKELIRHNQTGVMFKADDVPALVAAVQDLLAARERWPELRAAGRRFVELERNWQASAAHYAAPFAALRHSLGA